ncbi:short-chain dehydrogenase, putative [Talaromyces stipitatus ATCC 10500]|uniref:Short-chain dehydrogenase, putative n=1 Tax=Talaromyces stipitatus (strain ATCC 10500 / CBS 375.48 / QM 6759 / NRRL 1006) TaxID=441959 RepID=B8MTE4_TALSN|nr:short-chain dehydrogenase, putative [Talaromyces stipitatus ATCC 10500]EED12189.1 short-chain dehydrogenase, putative [Talaromyces stipitatus ATCC 10500]
MIRSPAPEDKTDIITGANVGLGLEAARELAAHGLTRLILATRDVSKAEAAKKTDTRRDRFWLEGDLPEKET